MYTVIVAEDTGFTKGAVPTKPTELSPRSQDVIANIQAQQQNIIANQSNLADTIKGLQSTQSSLTQAIDKINIKDTRRV